MDCSRASARGVMALAVLLLAGVASPGANLYVSTNSPNPGLPFNDWTNAARTIQAAVDAASDGDEVIVTNGIYDSGTRVTPGYSASNRVVITKAILVGSVNGPADTMIVGAMAPNGGCGPEAVRCVWMSAGILSGFTLTNGYTRQLGNVSNDCSGGGISALGGVATNCLVTGNRAYWYGGGVIDGTCRNCRIIGNMSYQSGGGAFNSALFDSEVSYNTSDNKNGGGASYGILSNCVIAANTAPAALYSACGGGVFHATLVHCVVWSNYSYAGGGVGEGSLENCVVASNTAHYGGGVYGVTAVGGMFVQITCHPFSGSRRSSRHSMNCVAARPPFQATWTSAPSSTGLERTRREPGSIGSVSAATSWASVSRSPSVSAEALANSYAPISGAAKPSLLPSSGRDTPSRSSPRPMSSAASTQRQPSARRKSPAPMSAKYGSLVIFPLPPGSGVRQE